MTDLRDEFATLHKKDIKNKNGEVVAQVDYISWSQAADRLDDTGSEWSFEIVQFGGDFVHGRLRIGDRTYENIGYAENADANWKKEPLKDAASDAFKRCAALAGVARYLYDKDDSHAGARPAATRQAAPARPQATVPPKPHLVNTDVPSEPDGWFDGDGDGKPDGQGIPVRFPDGGWQCPNHGGYRIVPAGTSKKTGKPYPAFRVCNQSGCEEKEPPSSMRAAR